MQRNNFLQSYQTGEDIEIDSESQCKIALEAIFSLDSDQFDVSFTRSKLLNIYERFYPFTGEATNYLFRWAITYLDNKLYR